MTYQEFIDRLPEGVKVPTFTEYTDFIEPVYNYHPAFSGNSGKDRAAKLYSVGGTGIFDAMHDVAEFAKEREARVSEIRRRAFLAMKKREEAKKAYDAAMAESDAAMAELKDAMAEFGEFSKAVRADWEV